MTYRITYRNGRIVETTDRRVAYTAATRDGAQVVDVATGRGVYFAG